MSAEDMDRSQNPDIQIFRCKDKETGALYHYANSDKTVDTLPVKAVDIIGRGSNGKVYLMQSTMYSNQFYAAKNFGFNSSKEHKNRHRRKVFMNETAILQSLNHDHIVKLDYIFLTPERGLLFMDYCPTGSLKVDNLSDGQVMRYFMNILAAVSYMHLKRIVHRDIKLDNILVKNDKVYLTDFGLSERLRKNSNLVCGSVGTPRFMAPEVYRASRHAVFDGVKADAYSTGVVLWCMLQRSKASTIGVFNLWSLLRASDKFGSIDSFLKYSARQLLEEDPKERTDIVSLFFD